MKNERFNNPKNLNVSEIASLITGGTEVNIQFSVPPPYSDKLLKTINALCGEHGELLSVRFYGHPSGKFDCGVLRDIPDVKSLFIDYFQTVLNIEEIASLRGLKRLALGIEELGNLDIFRSDNLKNLNSLVLGESKKGIDLIPVIGLKNLKTLSICGHVKNIQELGALKDLENLHLRGIPKTIDLKFVNQLSQLRYLHLVVGGRTNIDEIKHPNLSKLEIIRVLGFSSFLPENFPGLTWLMFEDQIKLESLVFKIPNNKLSELRILNCKKFGRLDGLKNLKGLKGLRVWRSRLSFDGLLSKGLPPNLKVFGFYTAKKKENQVIRAKLDKLGLPDF